MSMWFSFVVACSCALALGWPQRTEAQIRQYSRHAEADSVRAEAAKQNQIDALFDAREAELALELGSGGIKGVMGFWDRQGLLKKTLTADREWVMLFPMTRYMQAWHAVHGNELAPANMLAEAMRYRAQVVTDRHGNFEFRGLRPGMYLLLGQVPFSYDTYQTVDTGQRQISYSGWAGTGMISPVHKAIRAGVAHTMMPVVELVEVKEGEVTDFKPPKRDAE